MGERVGRHFGQDGEAAGRLKAVLWARRGTEVPAWFFTGPGGLSQAGTGPAEPRYSRASWEGWGLTGAEARWKGVLGFGG